MATFPERFWAKVAQGAAEDCWLWTGAFGSKGYGRIVTGRSDTGNVRTEGAHRVAYTLTKGPIPPGGVVCHSCDVPACCNPQHLWVGTHADNQRDKTTKGRQARGVAHGQSKLDPRRVIEMRRRVAAGEALMKVARHYGVNHKTARSAIDGLTWGWVTS